ncbi:MAG: fibronectin type III domain-containing protein, partial [Longimicrobiales bacterium]
DSDGRTMAAHVEWQSVDPGIATVDADGGVTGVTVGSTSIRASSSGTVRSASVTVTPELLLTASATEIEFAAAENDDPPAAQTITVATTEGSPPAGLTASVTYAAGPDGWLAAAVEDDGASVPLVVDHSDLAAGTYEAALTLASTAARQPLTITVRLLVLEPQPAIALSAPRASFSAPQGGEDPAEASITVANAGGGVLEGLTASVTYADRQPTGWLTATIDNAAPGALTLRARVGSLPAGIYTAHVDIAAAAAQNSPQRVTVTFSVSVPVPLIALDRSALSFTLLRGDANPAAQAISISNAGAGTLSNLAVSTTYASGQPGGWLTTALSATTAPATLMVGISADSLDAGTWTATVRVSSADAPNSQLINVTTRVDEPPPLIAVDADTVRFTAMLGATDPPPSQLTVTNVGGSVLDGLSAAVTYLEGSGGWLAATLGSTVAPSTLVLTAASAALPVGTHTARVALSSAAAENSPFPVFVLLTVSTVPPVAPSGLTATAVTAIQIDLAWADNSSDETAFLIERSLDQALWTAIFATEPGATTHADGTVRADSTYYYRVLACRDAVCSAPSSPASATTTNVPPAAPRTFSASVLSSSVIDVRWNAAEGLVLQYQLERRTGAGDAFVQVAAMDGAVHFYTDRDLTPSTGYVYRMRACNSTGCSPYTAELSVSTLPP